MTTEVPFSEKESEPDGPAQAAWLGRSLAHTRQNTPNMGWVCIDVPDLTQLPA
jgi:hypothetical protein